MPKSNLAAAVLVAGGMTVVGALTGCSSTSSALTTSTTCAEYMKLPADQRHDAANQLGMAHH